MCLPLPHRRGGTPERGTPRRRRRGLRHVLAHRADPLVLVAIFLPVMARAWPCGMGAGEMGGTSTFALYERSTRVKLQVAVQDLEAFSERPSILGCFFSPTYHKGQTKVELE